MGAQKRGALPPRKEEQVDDIIRKHELTQTRQSKMHRTQASPSSPKADERSVEPGEIVERTGNAVKPAAPTVRPRDEWRAARGLS